MKKRTNPFRKRAPSPQPQEAPQPKLSSEMSDQELDESLRKARRELLDIRHEELREREKARHAPGDAPGSSQTKPRLSEVFSKNNRRFK